MKRNAIIKLTAVAVSAIAMTAFAAGGKKWSVFCAYNTKVPNCSFRGDYSSSDAAYKAAAEHKRKTGHAVLVVDP